MKNHGHHARPLLALPGAPNQSSFCPGIKISHNLKKGPADLQALTTIQQNNFTPQPPPARDSLTLTVCVTPHPSTTSRQHCFHRTAPLYMERRIYFRSPLRGWELATPPYMASVRRRFSSQV